MMRFVRELRLIPVVLIATASLAALKLTGLLLDGGYLLTDLDPVAIDRPIHVDRDIATGVATVATDGLALPQSGPSWTQEMFGYSDITGSAAAEKPPEKPAGGKPEKPPDGKVIDLGAKPSASPGERALLEHLQERRQELESRGREIELRENMLQAAEKKIDTRANQLRAMEKGVDGAQQKKDEADAQQLKNLVTMYENMKAKDAARIFDRLEMRILVEVASLINPRRMSDILGAMSSEAAERLTVELANRAIAGTDRNPDISNLPKIEGKPQN